MVIAHCSRRFRGAASSSAVPGQGLGGILGATSEQALIVSFFTVSEVHVALKTIYLGGSFVSENLVFTVPV